MAQKNAKKAKPTKPAAKNSKAQKSPPSALKKAAKLVAKKVSAALNKKPPSAKASAKTKIPEKKASTLPKGKPGKKLPPPPLVPAKAGKKGAAPVAQSKAAKDVKAVPAEKAVKGKAGKKGEVLVELPAPKGVALLGREGKKKAKSEAAALAAKRRCREPGCEHDHTLQEYCRLHYIKNWRKIKRKEAILASGQLNNYVEELVNKYPDKYLDVIRQDLASEKDWAKVVVDLELESSEEEGAGGDEDLEGVATEGAAPRRERGGDFDDENESF